MPKKHSHFVVFRSNIHQHLGIDRFDLRRTSEVHRTGLSRTVSRSVSGSDPTGDSQCIETAQIAFTLSRSSLSASGTTHHCSRGECTDVFRSQSDLISPPVPALSVLDGDFLRHVFSQQYRPSVDLSTYFSPSTPTPPLYRPNFSPFTHTNELDPMSPSSKPLKLSHAEANSIRVLVNAYREAASYLSRSADELEQLT